MQEIKVASAKVDYARKRIRLGREEAEEARRKAEEEAEAHGAAEGGAKVYRSFSALAAHFEISRKALRKLSSAEDAPRKGRNGYSVREWSAYLLRGKNLSMEERAERSARVRYIEAQAAAREMANAERAGKMMPVEKVAEYVRRYSKEVADAIASVRERAAMRGLDAGLLKSAEEMSAEVNHIISERLAEWPA